MNPNTKIYMYNRRINGRFDSFKSAVKRIVKRTAQLAGAGGAFYAIFMLGAFTWSTSTTEAYTNTVIVQAEAPVLDRIADCESGSGKGTATHYDKNGQVLLRGNKNGTVDVGKYQINSVWYAKATELKLDLTKEEDNKKMAEHIYANYGTEPWFASKKCWMR